MVELQSNPVEAKVAETSSDQEFVAINFIDCDAEYVDRFEYLFKTRARAIDRVEGFIEMSVLKPEESGQYLVVSRWKSKEAFDAWVGSPEFHEGHKRAFADMAEYKAQGKPAPMKSDFKVYSILCR
jgi:heme-degrading monooxygenase HmoA